MLAFPIVEHLDVLKTGGLHGGMAGMTYAMYPLILEAVERPRGSALEATVLRHALQHAHQPGHAGAYAYGKTATDRVLEAVERQLSVGALSRQLPLRLIEQVMPYYEGGLRVVELEAAVIAHEEQARQVDSQKQY
jgi:hypothetical protein